MSARANTNDSEQINYQDNGNFTQVSCQTWVEDFFSFFFLIATEPEMNYVSLVCFIQLIQLKPWLKIIIKIILHKICKF